MPLPEHIQVTLPKGRQLIFRDSKQVFLSKFTFASINALFWLFWAYLLKIFFILLGWVFGFEWAYYQWVYLKQWPFFLNFLTLSAPFGLAICMVLLVWAKVNIFRFTGRVRRVSQLAPSLEQDCKWTHVPQDQILNARAAKVITCRHAIDGILNEVAVTSRN
ncbi:poly-beta-1,6-N-acetyl-D-glucosamine biosynthesis protein PgaD [Polynucleobacter sphagniphilus]|jgi:biofilm PGA synthesis protein PgaD|uniref:poly-beta-1,6-N-acetyl-D-glucosamine biosynthesis protein PgaD n=1 Tax=Polynucleobacter sphagniphilus TaxID=1743169 RepID=UPI00247B9832|nr:biofilm PGA synthesis protein PgaD [Polynucleobacter sphagniphilus]